MGLIWNMFRFICKLRGLWTLQLVKEFARVWQALPKDQSVVRSRKGYMCFPWPFVVNRTSELHPKLLQERSCSTMCFVCWFQCYWSIGRCVTLNQPHPSIWSLGTFVLKRGELSRFATKKKRAIPKCWRKTMFVYQETSNGRGWFKFYPSCLTWTFLLHGFVGGTS